MAIIAVREHGSGDVWANSETSSTILMSRFSFKSRFPKRAVFLAGLKRRMWQPTSNGNLWHTRAASGWERPCRWAESSPPRPRPTPPPPPTGRRCAPPESPPTPWRTAVHAAPPGEYCDRGSRARPSRSKNQPPPIDMPNRRTNPPKTNRRNNNK